jgi:sirohydrochlorin cobaltochelatase
MDAIILFSHGSLLCGAGEALAAHAARLRATGEYVLVEPGYMNYSEPAFLDAVARCATAGASRIITAPYFLAPGYFVGKCLPEHVAGARADYPEIDFVVAEAIGDHPALADAILACAADTLGPGEWRADLAAAARSCLARPECPLYGTPDCPRAPEPGSPVRPFVE